VGKTTLINEFCKDKKTVFFAAQENSIEQNLLELSNAITQVDKQGSVANIMYRSFADAFLRLEELAKEERVVFVIDEYPYLAQAYFLSTG
jgi:AAA+ ATPase superfamily predicted ATPase